MNPPTPASPGAPASRRWVLVATILGSGMAFIDGTVVNVALPAIQHDLQATAFQAQWVVEAYALFLAALLLAGGALGDLFGRRRVFVIGVGVFALASVACALSGGVDRLIAARAVQGVGAALLVPGSLALISASFPAQERGRAIGTWSGFSGITAALGPVLGGFLIDHYTWAWAFLINVPLAALVLLAVWRGVPESRGPDAQAHGVDTGGALLATAALGGIVYAMIEAPVQGWRAAPVLAACAVGIVSAGLFFVAERRARVPMLPLGLLRNRNFAGANLLTLWLYAALGGSLYFFPLTLMQVQGYPATATGAALLPFILIMFVLSRWAGTLVDRFGPRPPLVAGPLIAALGFALFTRPGIGQGPAGYWSSYFPAVVVLGLGMTVTVAPLTTTVMNSVEARMAGVASGVNNAVSRAAALLAIAVFGLIVARAFDAGMAVGLRAAAAPAPVVASLRAQRARLAAIEIPPGTSAPLAEALRRTVKQSYLAGFRRVMWTAAALAVLSALAAALMIRGDAARVAPPPRA